MDTVGQRLKFIIESKHLSQGKFGDLLNVPRQLVSNYVNDLSKPNYEFLSKLNSEMDVNLNWLIAEDGEPFKSAQFEQSENELTQKVRDILRQEGIIK